MGEFTPLRKNQLQEKLFQLGRVRLKMYSTKDIITQYNFLPKIKTGFAGEVGPVKCIH